jgi:hypothetical protein
MGLFLSSGTGSDPSRANVQNLNAADAHRISAAHFREHFDGSFRSIVGSWVCKSVAVTQTLLAF